MAVTKYWEERYGARPSTMSHDELEFFLPAPVPENSALELALEHYGFCPDVYQGGDYPLGALADSLSRSKIWYFWWD